MPVEVTTVAESFAVLHDGTDITRLSDLEPGSTHTFDGVEIATLAHPGGDLLARFGTVNDLHFGETECGVIEGLELGPIFRSDEGAPPYPETMNRAAVAEMDAADLDAIVVKGDLTTEGTRAEYDAFLAAYEPVFGDRFLHVRGNHDGYHGEDFVSEPCQRLDLPGVTIALLDTVDPRKTPGWLDDDQLEWLDALAADADRPVLVFGHHHVWDPASNQRPEQYFGILPDSSERLVEVIARRSSIRGYFAGHTHRNRVRHFAATGDVPHVEVACVKDFPGAWAEYRVFEGGILQVMHRISSPQALEWTERTRQMFGGMYPSYAFGALDDRCFPIPT